jgi:5-(carboxyamino)imidazole ribonucleotide synthase
MHYIAPSKTIGILGGGQLGRMMANAAAALGYRVHIFCPEEDCPASQVTPLFTRAAYDDASALRKFAEAVDVITYEFENIPLQTIEFLEKLKPVFPDSGVLSKCQHRVKEKSFVREWGADTADFRAVSSLAELQQAVKELGFPCVLKTCTMGYDGKGQAMIRNDSDVETAWYALKTDDAILEAFVPFECEISVIVARDGEGAIASYVPVENEHKHHILHRTLAPARVAPQVLAKAEQMAQKIAAGMNLVGLLAVEMFVTAEGRVLVNEMAPRPHNSGHWTMDACVTGQFEQSIRAICGLPLGSTERLADAEMLNLIGDDIHLWQQYIHQPNAKIHLYGKTEIKPGRKLGHINLLHFPPGNLFG